MSYGLVSENVDTYGPTIAGMKALREYVASTGEQNPHLATFVEGGFTDEPQQLSIECSKLARRCTDDDVKSTLINLAKASLKSKGRLSLC